MSNTQNLTRKCLLYLSFAALYSSCFDNNLKVNDVIQQAISDSVLNDIYDKQSNWVDSNVNKIKHSLNLDSSNKNNITLRFWTDYSSAKIFHRILEITIVDDSVHFRKITYSSRIESRRPYKESFAILSKDKIFLKGSVKSFVRKLFDSSFKLLLDQKHIETDGGLDGNSVLVEFKTKSKYFLTQFTAVDNKEVTSLPYQKLREILKVIEIEFNWSKYLDE